MAVPTITTDYTLIHAMDAVTGLTAWGTNAVSKWGATTEFYRENGISVALAPQNTGDTGIGVEATGGISLSTNRLFVWVNILGSSWVNTAGSTPAGVYIRIVTNTTLEDWTTDYNDYYVGGGDVAWVGNGWHLISLDLNRTADRTAGTTTLTNINKVGVGFNLTTTSSKSNVICVDVMRYGTKVEATGVTSSSATHDFNDNGASADTITRGSGSFVDDGMEDGDIIRVAGTVGNDGEYTVVTATALTLTLATGDLPGGTETGVTSNVDAAITLESIYTKDGPTDDLWYGVVSKDRNGNYEINGKLLIGDESGSLRTFFTSRGDSVILADQPLSASAAEQGVWVHESTGNTIFTIGQSTGTGDSRVGFGGSFIRQDTTYVSTLTEGAALGKFDFSIAVSDMEIFGTTFSLINDGIAFANDVTHYVTNTNFDGCAQVDLYATETRNNNFLNYAGTDGAILWRNSVTDLENSNFLACSRGVEHDTATAGQTYYGLKFFGNTYDVHNSSASGTVVINATKSSAGVTSNPSTFINSASGTTTINNTVALTVTCKNSAGNAIEGVRVRIELDPAKTLVSEGSTDAVGVYTDATYNYGTATDVKIVARLKGFKFNSAFDTITADGLSIPFSMIKDPAVNLP